MPAPQTLALDADGEKAGHAAHLMTWVSGEPDPGRSDPAAVGAMVRLLAAIHEVRSEPMPRLFQSWASEEKWVVPPFAHDSATWRRAFDVLAAGSPEWEPCFL